MDLRGPADFFLKSEIQANSPTYSYYFSRDLQHFLDHGGECDFSEVLSGMNVREHLVPARRVKSQVESNVAFDFTLSSADEKRFFFREESTSECLVILHFT